MNFAPESCFFVWRGHLGPCWLPCSLIHLLWLMYIGKHLCHWGSYNFVPLLMSNSDTHYRGQCAIFVFHLKRWALSHRRNAQAISNSGAQTTEEDSPLIFIQGTGTLRWIKTHGQAVSRWSSSKRIFQYRSPIRHMYASVIKIIALPAWLCK